jgi:hypothetical protein
MGCYHGGQQQHMMSTFNIMLFRTSKRTINRLLANIVILIITVLPFSIYISTTVVPFFDGELKHRLTVVDSLMARGLLWSA